MLNQIKKKHKRAGRLQEHTSLFYQLKTEIKFHVNYDQQILKVLTEAGDYGVSVQSVVKHVYNMNRTFFSQPDYEDVKSYVQQFLLRNSKSAQSLIERTGQRGYYRLNTQGSQDARQLMLQFTDDEPKEEEKPRQDFSLSLFD